MAMYFGTGLLLCVAVASAWPTGQGPNGQAPLNPQWPRPQGEGDKPFDMPKSLVYPLPSPPNGADGSNAKYGQQQKASPMYQGLGTDPWSSFQTNNPFGSGNPFDFGTQEAANFESSFNSLGTGNEDFPYTRPYRNLFPQIQYPQQPPPRPMMPDSMYGQESMQPYPMAPNGAGGPLPPRGPNMGMNGMNGQMPPPPPPQRQHQFGHMNMMGQNHPFDWMRVMGRSNAPEMAPPSSPFDFAGPRSIEYSPMKPPNGTVPAITVQYNVTYTFTPWGWKTVDVTVSNATFHTSLSERAVDITGAPGGGVMPFPGGPNSDTMTSGWWWWPRKNGSEPDTPPGAPAKPEEKSEPTEFVDALSLPHLTPIQ